MRLPAVTKVPENRHSNVDARGIGITAMFTWKSYANLAVAIAFGALAAGCGTIGGAKTAIVGDKLPQKSADMPDRPKLAMPAPNMPLPVPGQGTAAPAAWAATTQQPAKQAAVVQPAAQQGAAAVQPQQTQESGSWYSGVAGVFR
jgi:hypothetical protein